MVRAMRSKSLGAMIYASGLVTLLLATVVAGLADSELPNYLYITAAGTDGSSSRGDRYAKCIPSGLMGSRGSTIIYLAKADGDVVLHTYQWYSAQIQLSVVSGKTSLARLGPWNYGSEASSNDLAFAFY